jgi:type VI secretion system protein ImpH
LRHHDDPALVRFADIFHHRALLLFYRAWAQAQPAPHLDRPADDDYSRWVDALMGRRGSAGRTLLPDAAGRFHAASLARGPRNAEGLEKILRQYFGVPVRVQSHVGHWIRLRPQDCTQLVPASVPQRLNALGAGAVAGNRAWDRQSRFRVRIGPLSLADYQRFLPGQRTQHALREWVGQYAGLSMSWDVRLCLRGGEVPRLQLPRRRQAGLELEPRDGLRGCLGWTTWLGRRGVHADRDDLRLQPGRAR